MARRRPKEPPVPNLQDMIAPAQQAADALADLLATWIAAQPQSPPVAKIAKKVRRHYAGRQRH